MIQNIFSRTLLDFVKMSLLFLGVILYSFPAFGQNAPNRPNIILISIDTLRADFLSTYGYERQTSPSVDQLASEGVTFLNAFSHSPKTTPSHMSMMTSLTPSVHGIFPWGRREETRKVLNPNIPTLAEILKQNGYSTVAFTGNAHVHKSRGFGRGFDTYKHYYDIMEPVRLDEAFDWLNGTHDSPFFMFLHSYSVHAPYLPPAPYNRLYDPDYEGPIFDNVSELKKTTLGKKFRTRHKLYWSKVDTNNPREVDFLKSLYAGSIRYMDKEIVEKALEIVKNRGLEDNTLVIFTSDHGDAFGEHGQFKHNNLHKETLHVPLIIKYPGFLPADKKIPQSVRLIDIMPTILDLLNIDPKTPMQGTSLLPTLKGKNLNLSVYSETRRHKIKSLRTGKYAYFKYEEDDDRGEYELLYERNKDPLETQPLKLPTFPFNYTLKKVRKEFNQWQQSNKDLRALLLSEEKSDEVSPDSETIANLKSLGYLQ